MSRQRTGALLRAGGIGFTLVALAGSSFMASSAASSSSAATPTALTPQSVGPGYPLVKEALSGAKGPSGCKKTYNIWYVNPLPQTPDWGRSAKEFTAAGPALCYKPHVVGPNAIDIPTMVSEIHDAIAAHADAILTCSLSPTAFAPAMKAARKQGIVVANIACTGAPGTQNFFMGSIPQTLGTDAADALIKKTGGNANIGIVMTDATTPNQVQELAAFKKQIASHHGMKIVDTEFDNSDAGVAEQKMSAMLTAHPEINTIWTIEGAAPGSVPTAMRAAGKSPGKVTVLAIDLQKPTCLAIKQHWIWASQVQLFFDSSPLAAKWAIEIKQGKKPPTTNLDTSFKLVSASNIPPGRC